MYIQVFPDNESPDFALFWVLPYIIFKPQIKITNMWLYTIYQIIMNMLFIIESKIKGLVAVLYPNTHPNICDIWSSTCGESVESCREPKNKQGNPS